MALQIGIVGLPNVGKSTLFNALTKSAAAEAANYPFCTIDPNVGVVEVPDDRLAKLSAIVKPERIVPNAIEFVDIAGIVKGASEGEGLGNQFLSHIRECDAIAQVVRSFSDKDVIHVHGGVNPKNDIETINAELLLADLQTVEKRLAKVTKGSTGAEERTSLERLMAHLGSGQLAVKFERKDEEQELIKTLHLLTDKPFLYIANVDENGVATFDIAKAKAEFGLAPDDVIVPVSAKIESELGQMDPEDAALFLEEMGMTESGLSRLIRAAYEKLGLWSYFTAGVKEVRAWTIHKGYTAPQAAGVIHTDFEKGFIRAEVISFDDFVHLGGEAGAKEAGKMRLEGKEYIMKDGDICHFRFSG